MNCERAERTMLLAGTDESGGPERLELERHLTGCAQCRALQADTERLLAVSRGALYAGEPAEETIRKIQAAGSGRATTSGLSFRRPAVQALAYAAGLMLLLGAWFVLNADGQAQRISDVSTVVAMLSTDLTVEEGGSATADEEAELRALALQLLEMEGFLAEDITGGESAEPEPTALRFRSTPGSPAQRCV